MISSKQLFLYDLENEVFLKKPTFKPNHDIIHQSFCIHDSGSIYSIGGFSLRAKRCLDFCSEFDILREKWLIAPSLVQSRSGAASCSLDS